jgi:hypothetical protein
MKNRKRHQGEPKKQEYLELFLKTQNAAKRAKGNISKMGAILKKALPPKDFEKFGEPQVKNLEKLADKLLIETDQLHELWLKKKQ